MTNIPIQTNSGTQSVLGSNRTSHALFSKAVEDMIATNDNAYKSEWSPFRSIRTRIEEYTPQEVASIIESGDLKAQRRLSYNYFVKDGFYKRLLLYYATFLNYTGILIPNPGFGKELSQNYIEKRYHNAINFINVMSLPSFFTHCAQRVYIYGCYYGLIQKMDKATFSVLDLPVAYCSSRFKDENGNDIIELNITYFDSIFDQKARKIALETYPELVKKHYEEYKKGNTSSKWVMLPTDISICFPLFDETPLFLNVIPATIEYDEAVETERERDLEEIKKIIIQKIPHLSDGTLLFEPEEAAVMHKGAVDMMKSNKNISVLTSYADVDAIVSKTAADTVSNNLEKMVNNIYNQAGVSSQLFAATGNLALESSIQNDLALAMVIAHKFENFVTNIINRLYGNSNITFKYTILPISRYNESEYITNSFKLAASGYSLLLPMLAMGFSQQDVVNLKDLENDVLHLRDKLIPPETSYTQSTQSTREAGAPAKSNDEKSDKTIQNEQSIDSGGSE